MIDEKKVKPNTNDDDNFDEPDMEYPNIVIDKEDDFEIEM